MKWVTTSWPDSTRAIIDWNESKKNLNRACEGGRRNLIKQLLERLQYTIGASVN